MGCGRLAVGGPSPREPCRDTMASVKASSVRRRSFTAIRGDGCGLAPAALSVAACGGGNLRRIVSLRRRPPTDWRPSSTPSVFVEDRGGQLWIGTYDNGLVRYRDGRFTMFTAADGAPDGMVTALLVDHAGRLWIGSNRDGLTRVDAPMADSPVFVTIGRSAGLLSQNVRCLVEDRYGRIYFGTSRGVGRLDPATGRMMNFDSAYGLASGMAAAALRDDTGALWFGTPTGVSRMVPRPDEVESPPPVLLGGMRIAGTPHPIAEWVSDRLRTSCCNRISVGWRST